ncbi:MAG: c-type cytochrome [Bacteroidota bacterium]
MRLKLTVITGLLFLAAVFIGASSPNPNPKKSTSSHVERGKYLVMIGGCNHCHSPKMMTPMGPIPDTTKLLSGHPGNFPLPDVPKDALAPDKWGVMTTGDLTAWVGPWGISFARNLTPDMNTGLGSWTEDIFIKALRTGKDMGEGRTILPPMPWQEFGQMTNQDLKDVWAYLKSLPPVDNAVPDPISPTGEKLPTGKKTN